MEARRTTYHSPLETWKPESCLVGLSPDCLSACGLSSLSMRSRDSCAVFWGQLLHHKPVDRTTNTWTEPQILTEPQIEIVITTLNKPLGLLSWCFDDPSPDCGHLIMWAFKVRAVHESPVCFASGLLPQLDRNCPPTAPPKKPHKKPKPKTQKVSS